MNAKTFAARLNAAFGPETTAARLERLAAAHPSAWEGMSAARLETLTAAAELGADDAALVALADASRTSRGETIVLPAGRLEGLSRGRGWARQGRGDGAVWGERTDRGYRVGPGRWTVGATDGFKRQERMVWEVSHVTIAPGVVWTVAS